MNEKKPFNRLSSLGINPFSRKLAKNSGYLFLGGGAATLFATLQSILLARLLGSEDFGYLALIIASVEIVLQFIDFRTWEGLITLLPASLLGASDDRPLPLIHSFFLVDLLAGLLTILIVGLLGDLLAAEVADSPNLASSIRLYAWIAPALLIANGTCMGVLRAFDKFALITIKSAAVAAFQLLLVLAALLLEAGLMGVIIALVFAQFVDMLASLILAGRLLRKQFGAILTSESSRIYASIRRHSGLLGQLWITGSVKSLQSRADIILLGILATPSAVGLYRLALDLAGLVGRIGSPIQDSTLPLLADLITREKYEHLLTLIKQLTLTLSLLLLPGILLAALLAEPVITFLAGEDYGGAAEPFAILLIGMSVNTILIWTRPLLVARKKITISNLIFVAGFIVEVIVIFALVPQWQETGAAIAMTIMYALVGFSSAWFGLQGLKKLARQEAQ